MRKSIARIAIVGTLLVALTGTATAAIVRRVEPATANTVKPPAWIVVPKMCVTADFMVSWAPTPTRGASYQLQEATDPLFTSGVRTAYKGMKTKVLITGRANGSTYYYRVQAVRNNYLPSTWVAGSWGCLINRSAGGPASIVVPASSSTGEYPVSWGASPTAGVAYELEEAVAADFSAGLRTAYAGNLLSAAITGRTNATTYYYRVRATRAGWYPSAWVAGAGGCAVSWTDVTSPGPVTDFTAAAAPGRVDLSWIGPSDADFAGVKVLRRTDRLPVTADDGTVVYDGSGESCSDTGLDPGTHYYAAFAYDTALNFSAAATASAAVAAPTCADCHGNPPLRDSAGAGGLFDRTLRPDAESYLGGAGAHERHRDALGAAIFACEICHGPDPGTAAWHNQGGGTVVPGNVDLIGQKSSWDPPATRAGGYDGNAGVANPDPNLWEFTAKARAGGDQRCFNFACHGDPPDTVGALNWTDRMVDDASGSFVGDGKQICAWCHDDTPALFTANGGASYTAAPNVMGDGSGYGAEVNGHGLGPASRYDRAALGDGLGRVGAGKDCTVCHDAGYQANGVPPPARVPRKTHFDGTDDSAEKRLRGTINGRAASNADAVCEACHQQAGADAGTPVAHHGNSGAGGYGRLEESFTRVCRQCHDVHGANWNGAGRNLAMVGTWLDLNHNGLPEAGEEARVDSNAVDAVVNITAADNAVVYTSRTGDNSLDAPSGVASTHVCATCHVPATGGGAGTGGGDHAGATGYTTSERGNDCTQCHGHDFELAPATADGFMASLCEGCHNGNTSFPLAPNVLDGSLPGGAGLAYNWYGTNGARQDGGHGDPQGRGGAASVSRCTDCHDLGQPAPGNLHLNGSYESIWDNTTGNANTAHLKAEFFTKFPANGPGAWSIQVAFDNYCYKQCHTAYNVPEMTHEGDTLSSDASHNSVEMGTHGTVANADALIGGVNYPFDRDLNSNAAGPTFYATCVTCHDPHGTTLNEPARLSNRMVRDRWTTPPTHCNACHR